MGRRDFAYQQAAESSALVPGVQHYRLPLLPYERHLISILGCSEEEYCFFAEEVRRKALAPRAAEYDNIPDIQNVDVVSVLVSIAVGIAATAISAALAPKPKPIEIADISPEQRAQQLSSLSGPSRFVSTSGFDSQLALASYNNPIPIIFTRYTGFSGGVNFSGSLVWSRAFSYGYNQGVKLLMIIGEQGQGEGIAKPDLSGVMLGSTPLSALGDNSFAFYWKRNSNAFSRVKSSNFAYGTRATPDSADPETSDDIFLCPTRSAAAATGFCQVYNPSSNTEFGVFGAVANGTDYRVDWRVVYVEYDERTADPLMERIKIAGDYGFTNREEIKDRRQLGVGRGYGRHMGITEINGTRLNSPGKDAVIAKVGDIAKYVIGGGALPEDQYYLHGSTSVKVDDINNAIDNIRIQADDMLQLGETVMIGRTVWTVIDRAINLWERGATQVITLQCIELFGEGTGAQVGIVSNDFIAENILNDNLSDTTGNQISGGIHAGCGFYPLAKVSFATIRNTRECEVTEIGLRSQVWNRASNLCNFASLPTPDEQRIAENKKVVLTSGTMNIYFKRTSCFTIFLRPAEAKEDGSLYEWKPLGEQFCVTGNQPVDQYNFIRLVHPDLRQYEFRFIPKSGADVARHSPDDAVFLRLNAKTGAPFTQVCETSYGRFKVQIVGERVEKTSITFNPEMTSGAQELSAGTVGTIPGEVTVRNYIPDTEPETYRAASVRFRDWLPRSVSRGREQSFLYEIFGRPRYMGQRGTGQRTHSVSGGRSITLEYVGRVDEQYPSSSPYFPNEYAWSLDGINVISSSGGFNTNERIDCTVSLSNPRASVYGLSVAGVQVEVTSTSGHIPRGRQSAWMFEKLGNSASYGIGSTRTVTITGTSNGRSISLNLTAQVVSAPPQLQADFPGVTTTWDNEVYTVNAEGSSGVWNAGEYFELTQVVSSANPFKQAGTITGVGFNVYNTQEITTSASFFAERIFEQNSQINDLSFYSSSLIKSNDTGPEHAITYVNESRPNAEVPLYSNMTLAGLVIRSSRQFSQMTQPRFWLGEGVPVKKFEPDSLVDIGPSNKFPDLVYYLLSDPVAGLGDAISLDMIDTSNFPLIAKFHKTYKLFFDGAIDGRINIRQFIADMAPNFLCNFTITNGKFGLAPAVPLNKSGEISLNAVPIVQLFTSGNIIQDSFRLEYLDNEERKNFQASMRYRQERKNQLPEERSVIVRWQEAGASSYPIESFDLTQFCTTEDHAILLAQYFLSVRRRITHTINFKTSPAGMSLGVGDYIRVATESSPYNSANNGIINSSGEVTSVQDLPDGRYDITYYVIGDDDTQEGSMTVSNGTVLETALYNAVFTIQDKTISTNVYLIEQLTLDEDGLVDISASDFPTDDTLVSLISQDLMDRNSFEVVN